jgi:HK97 family phage portal protein
MHAQKSKKLSMWNKAKKAFSANENEQKSSSPIYGYAGYQTFVQEPGKPVWTPRAYDQFANEAYTKNVVAHRCVSMIARAAACVPYKLVDSGGIQVEKHPVLNLLNKPNPCCLGKSFLESVLAFKLIAGNSYILAVGNGDEPKELYVLRPDRVRVIAGHGGMAAGYVYTVGQKETRYMVNPVDGSSPVLHLKEFHPLDDYYGMSRVEAAAYSIDQHNQAAKWNQSLLQNGAKPSGALVVKSDGANGGTLTDEQFGRIKNQMEEEYSGAVNAGRPLLLEGGLDWKEMSLSPKDMDFVESKNSSARDIALAFGVPPQLLGIPGDNTYSNLVEARLALWEQTVLPMVDDLTLSLNSWLMPQFKGAFELQADLNKVSALAPRREALWKRMAEADFLTDDEKRKVLGV